MLWLGSKIGGRTGGGHRPCGDAGTRRSGFAGLPFFQFMTNLNASLAPRAACCFTVGRS